MKFIKPLPKPIEISKKKRGGKRVRKMKERYAMTEFRKQANRLNFGDVSVISRFHSRKKKNHSSDFLNALFSSIRSRKMPIRMIWVIRVERSAKLARVEFDYRKSMRKLKCASARHSRKTSKSNRFTVETQQFASKFLVRLRVLHSHQCKAWKLSIHKQPKDRSTPMQSTSQTHLDFYQLENEQPNYVLHTFV